MFIWLEFGLAALSIAAAYAYPSLGASWFECAEQLFDRLAQKQGLSVLIVGLGALAARAALLPLLPVPQPAVHDEFGYLLLADTFAHGRVTNPTHPMWVHFESFYILWQPSYFSKYYPAQGLIMAFGQVVFRHPFWGVWLSVGLMCAAICWMLQGWLPPGWALLGGFLAVIRLGTFSYWASSYWGGAVAATGGALVLGALPRIKQTQRARDALLMGLGFAILANSRPYEGLFFGLPIAGALGLWIWGARRAKLPQAVKRIIAPLSLVLLLTLIAMGYYFWRTTGSPWVTPQGVCARTYFPPLYFPWQKLQPARVYHHAVMRDFYQRVEVAQYKMSRSAAGFVTVRGECLGGLGFFYLGPILMLPLLLAMAMAPYGLTWKGLHPDTRFLLLVCGSAIAGSMLLIWFSPHYAAAITAALLALVLQALRHVRSRAAQGRPWGLLISRAVPLICLMMLALRVVGEPLHLGPPPWPGESVATWCSVGAVNLERAATLARLEQCGGKQLAIVRYGPDHNLHTEWVYNRADLGSAKVIWARDMGPVKNNELIEYFRDRQVWLVEVNADDRLPRVSPYHAPP